MKAFSLKRKAAILLFFISLCCMAVCCYMFKPYQWWLENHYTTLYDLNHPQSPVLSREDIDEVLNEFKQIHYSKLNENYIQYSNSDEAKYKEILKNKTYYIIQGDAIFKFLVGNFRIKNFLAKDEFYIDNLISLGEKKT